MPPKAKKPDANKNQGPIEDESGIPKNEVTFKFSFEIKQNEISDILIMFEWVNSKDSTGREKLDTELIEGWDAKAPEDPTMVCYEVETSSFVVEDKFVKNLCSSKFYVHFVSAEDQRVKDTLMLHYSPLLTAKGEPKFEFFSDKIKIAQVESFRLTVTADKELLTPMFKDYLNPLEVCILGAKEMPVNNSSYDKYEPVYVQTKFFDGTIIKTHEQPHAATCKWAYKQVILVGLMNPIKLAEELKSYPLTFEVHDQDEVAKNNIKDFKQLIEVKYEEPEPPVDNDPKNKGKNAPAAGKDNKKGKEPEKKDDKAKDAKDKGKKDPKKKKDVKTFEPIKEQDTREINRANYGVSAFNLNDLLNPHLTTVKLRNHIVPLQKYEDKDAKNLDLNTTARRDIQGLHVGCDYMSNESYLVVTFEIAHAIRAFKKPAAPEGETNAEPAAAKPKPTPAAKTTAQPKKGSVVPEEVNQLTKDTGDEKAIYERAVYIFPYKSPDATIKLLSIIQKINTSAFGQEDNNTLFLTTKNLTEEEKRDRDLDIITGVEFIDYEYRTFILEGISDKGMKRLEEEFPKIQPNSKGLTILKNSDFKFKDRLYLNFNIDIKKIKLRENLTKLLSRPEIYLRSKVPEHIYNILISFSELRRCENMKAVVASHLFPDAENIMAMERKYGDALTDEDIDGREGSPQKTVKRTMKATSELALSGIQSPNSYMTPVMTSKRLENISKSAEKLPAIKERGGRSLSSTKLATKVELVEHDKYNLHMTKLYPVKEGEQIFLGSGTALNVYEKQRTELREIVRNDPNHFYTYSADYLSLSIDPFNAEDIKKAELEKKKNLWRTPDGFQTVIKKSKQDYIMHSKRPHPSKIDELTSFPWHTAKLEETAHLKNTRGDPIRTGPDFKSKVAGVTFFSSPEIVEAEKITAVEKERQIREAKKKAEEDWKSKLIVNNPYFYTSLCMDRNSQLDKIKGIRMGDAVKKGIVLKDTRLKTTTLGTTKTLQENPISMYLTQEWEETGSKNFFERKLDVTKATSKYDFKTNIKEPHQYEFVYKPMKETFKSNL